MADGDTTLTSVERAFAVVDYLREVESAGVTEVARGLDIPTSTAHTHLTTLEQLGYIVKRDGSYYVGLRFLELGESARNRRDIYDIARGEVEQLANETGELVGVMVEEHGQGVYLHRSRGDQVALADTRAGRHVNLHSRAAGKSILAHLPDGRIAEIIDQHGLPRETDRTITSRDELEAELATIREDGYAIDDGEQLKGLRCVAAPIVSDGNPVGAISVSGPKGRIRGDRFRDELPELVTSTANVIEVNISYS